MWIDDSPKRVATGKPSRLFSPKDPNRSARTVPGYRAPADWTQSQLRWMASFRIRRRKNHQRDPAIPPAYEPPASGA